MFSFEPFLDLLPKAAGRAGEGFLLLRGGVGGMSPVMPMRESILLQSIFIAATGVRRNMSTSSGRAPSSAGGDAIGGRTPGSVEGSGAEGRGGGGDESFEGS